MYNVIAGEDLGGGDGDISILDIQATEFIYVITWGRVKLQMFLMKCYCLQSQSQVCTLQ
jgi:hypothetical protein